MNTALVLHNVAPDAGKDLPLALAGHPAEIQGKPCHYRRKEIIADGTWVHRGQGNTFDINPTRTGKWIENYARRLAAGIKTPVLKRHTESPSADDTLGYIVGIERAGEKVYADFQFIGDDAVALAARNDVSIYEKAEGRDAKGNVFGQFLDHVALTPNPNQPNLGPFVTIAASASGAAVEVPVFEISNAGDQPEENPMLKPETLTKLRAKLSLGTDVKDADVAERAAELALTDPPADKTAEVTALSADKARLESELATAKSQVLSLSANAPEELKGMTLALTQDAFKSKRDHAIASGNISEAGMKLIDSMLLPNGMPSAGALALSGDGAQARPFYGVLCDIIAGNPGIKLGNTVTRATPTLQLGADATTNEQMTDERRAYVAQSMGVTLAAKSA